MMRGRAAGSTILRTLSHADSLSARETSKRRGSMPAMAERVMIMIGQRQEKATMAISMR